MKIQLETWLRPPSCIPHTKYNVKGYQEAKTSHYTLDVQPIHNIDVQPLTHQKWTEYQETPKDI